MRVPVVIIGGFLGAGKTTAINHMLSQARQPVAVLVNDFGALNIDAQLVASHDGGIFALSNGCVCCSIGPDFSATLARMLTLSPLVSRIIVETSGVSDPWRIAQLVKLEAGARLEAVVVLADALELPRLAADRWLSDTISRQIARADLVALSKCDIAPPAARSRAESCVRTIRADVTIIEIIGGALPAIVVNPSRQSAPGRFLADSPGHEFLSWHWRPPRALDQDRLANTLRALPAGVLRGKAILKIAAQANPMVLQLVGRRWSLTSAPELAPAHELVLIGTQAMPAPQELELIFAPTLVS